MILDKRHALIFIDSYKKLLLEINGTSNEPENGDVLHALAAARVKLAEKPSLINHALDALKENSIAVDPDVVDAVRTLDVQNWIFLRDTKRYSIFVHPSGCKAYGVVGLTERLRDIAGGTGVMLETGLVRYRDQYVCDGLVTRIVWLGRNYKEGFNERYRAAKREGRFHVGRTE